jgi:HD-GYP domain-containing protein (c-di-GMP phosphodiesterase class II)
VLSLITALGAHDRRTRGHSERVRVFTDLLAEELRLDQDARDGCAGPRCSTTSAS